MRAETVQTETRKYFLQRPENNIQNQVKMNLLCLSRIISLENKIRKNISVINRPQTQTKNRTWEVKGEQSNGR